MECIYKFLCLQSFRMEKCFFAFLTGKTNVPFILYYESFLNRKQISEDDPYYMCNERLNCLCLGRKHLVIRVKELLFHKIRILLRSKYE